MQKLISSISVGALIMTAITASAQTSPSTQTQPQTQPQSQPQVKGDPNRLATQDEIKMMVEAKAYRPALQAIAKAFPQTNAKVPEYDKYTLLMLRAQCLLETNDPSTALLAYQQAAALPLTLANYEAAQAMVLLLKNKGPGATFVPKFGDKTPIELNTAEGRKKAIASLYYSQYAVDKPIAEDAAGAANLVPVLNIIPRLRDLHALATQGTGDDKEVVALVQPIGQHAAQLISSEITRCEKQIEAIRNAASRMIGDGSGSVINSGGRSVWVPNSGLNGLDPSARATLREAIDYLGQIHDTCDKFYHIAQRYERNTERWQSMATAAKTLRETAIAVYENE
jgi:hypothetical protein